MTRGEKTSSKHLELQAGAFIGGTHGFTTALQLPEGFYLNGLYFQPPNELYFCMSTSCYEQTSLNSNLFLLYRMVSVSSPATPGVTAGGRTHP